MRLRGDWIAIANEWVKTWKRGHAFSSSVAKWCSRLPSEILRGRSVDDLENELDKTRNWVCGGWSDLARPCIQPTNSFSLSAFPPEFLLCIRVGVIRSLRTSQLFRTWRPRNTLGVTRTSLITKTRRCRLASHCRRVERPKELSGASNWSIRLQPSIRAKLSWTKLVFGWARLPVFQWVGACWFVQFSSF